MISASRRTFLFGLGAAVATAKLQQLPFAIAAPTPEISPGVVIKGWRMYRGIQFVSNDYGLARVFVCRGDTVLLNLSNGGSIHWQAYPGNELLVPEEECLRIDYESDAKLATAELLFRTDDGRSYVELHTFPSRGPAQIIPVHKEWPPKPYADLTAEEEAEIDALLEG